MRMPATKNRMVNNRIDGNAKRRYSKMSLTFRLRKIKPLACPLGNQAYIGIRKRILKISVRKIAKLYSRIFTAKLTTILYVNFTFGEDCSILFRRTLRL